MRSETQKTLDVDTLFLGTITYYGLSYRLVNASTKAKTVRII